MPTEIKVPTTGNSGEDAVVLEWLVDVGATVVEGETLVVLETAKATVDVAAPTGGTLLAIAIGVGADAAEHATLGLIGVEGEVVVPLVSGADAGEPAVEPEASAARLGAGVAAEAHRASAPSSSAHRASAPSSSAPSSSARPKASPRAAVVAQRNGIDLADVTGTGPGGRILALDVIAARRASEAGAPAAQRAAASAPAVPTAMQPTAVQPSADYTSVPVRGARKVTAQRMHASLATTAQVTLTRYADAAPLMGYLGRLRASAERLDLPRLTVNDLVLFATARTMARHPEANATFDWEEIRQYSRVDLGVAVDTGRALLVPVIRDAASLGLIELARATAAVIDRARSGAITTGEMEGGTMTVSNLGGAGVHWFTPVLNPPQVCILGVGRALPASPSGADLMPLSLTFDHRAIDGAAAGAVLADLADAIENIDILAAL